MDRSEALLQQWLLYDQKKYGQAFRLTREVLGQLQGADLHDAQRLLGLCCLRQRQYTQASLWFKKACQGSDNSKDWLNLARSAALQGNLALSAEAFEQVRLIQQSLKYGQATGFYRQVLAYASALCEAQADEPLQALLDELCTAARTTPRPPTCICCRCPSCRASWGWPCSTFDSPGGWSAAWTGCASWARRWMREGNSSCRKPFSACRKAQVARLDSQNLQWRPRMTILSS
jgi:tetratricopeptide (TPR) repeat protein